MTPDDTAMPPDDLPEDPHLRRLLRGLPEVDPPDGFFDDLIRRKHRRARIVAGAALALAVVAGVVVVAHATGITGRADPVLDELADRHATVLTVDVRSLDGGMEGDDLPAPYQAPAELGPFQRGMAVWHTDDVVQVVYTDDSAYLSLFEEVGEMEEGDMSDGLHRFEVAGVTAWRTDDGMVVVRRHDVVYVLVGDLDDDELADVVEDLPDARPMGMTRRIKDAMDDLVSAFGLD